MKGLAWGTSSGLAGGPAKGHFFCARVDDRVFLRFVPLEDGQMLRNTLACLRMITCAEETKRHLPEGLAATSYDAWAKARQDIYAEWMFATDPLNLQPRIRPFFRNAADHLRKYPPTEIRQNELRCSTRMPKTRMWRRPCWSRKCGSWVYNHSSSLSRCR